MNNIDLSAPGCEGMLCGMAPTAKSAKIGQRAATDAPGGRPSTLPKASEPPGALSCAYNDIH